MKNLILACLVGAALGLVGCASDTPTSTTTTTEESTVVRPVSSTTTTETVQH